MVISQIAGLATAFGTGELSGAGFGPNYTILMKLGYEFYAPRILEEMEKNPNIFFQDTLWFQKFQKQIKLYSDKVMKETLDTLINVPQETIDSIAKKYREEGVGAIPSAGLGIPITASPALNQINTIVQLGKIISDAFSKMNFSINIIPQAFGATPVETHVPTPQSNLQTFQELQVEHEGPPRPTQQQKQKQTGGRAISQRNHEIKYDKLFRDLLTKTANIVNKITSVNKPTRRVSQSSILQNKTSIIAGATKLRQMKIFLKLLKKDYADINGNAKLLRTLLLLHKSYEKIQIRIATHLVTYGL